MIVTIDGAGSTDKRQVLNAAYNMWQVALGVAHIAPYSNKCIDYWVKQLPALIAMLNPHAKALYEARNVELHWYAHLMPVYLARCNHVTFLYNMHIPWRQESLPASPSTRGLHMYHT